ncbi:hypothetical protein WICMUC_000660 [Wickerhamomyces mucosus]|uniref:AMP deaminase n=1 Tax=Wickerhamomyces mucosus TaxID=1378264 RepID=A0A9P8PYG4_9ASCO|nr:hypothetical protein WICMUC_000660 [Wickerhamomyces mucosus]
MRDVFQSRDIIYDDEVHLTHQSTNSKSDSIKNYLPLNQILYAEGHSVEIPSSLHNISLESDMIPINTRFDTQASLGEFTIEDEDFSFKRETFQELDNEHYSNNLRLFSIELNECLKLRDYYQDLSHQNPICNPINSDNWKTYPPPVPKGWNYAEEYGTERNDYYYDSKATPHYYGQSFNLEDYKLFFEESIRDLKTDGHEVFVGKHNSFKVTNFEFDSLPNFGRFFNDLQRIVNLSIDREGTSLAYQRLNFLRAKFENYLLLNENKETLVSKLNPHRDFYNVRKVDNNIDLSMSMSKKHLLNVINLKLREEPDRVVYKDEKGVSITLSQLFEPYFNETGAKKLNIDDLFEFGIIDRNFNMNDIMIDRSTDYESIVRNEILLKIDQTFLRIENESNGEYLSDTLKQVLSDYEKSKYQYGELGINFNLLPDFEKSEGLTKWESIANWVIDNKLISHNVKWIIRIPRNYAALRKVGKVSNFQEFLGHIFKQLFEISINPRKNIKLHYFLTKISAIDLLSGSFSEDTSVFDYKNLVSPNNWTTDENPPYSYYLYYIFLNLSNLNKFRKSRNLNCFNLRNHVASMSQNSGIGIITETLASNYLLGKNIINGEQLIQYPVLQYLYYLKQIGITMSPLTWNKKMQLINDDDRFVSQGSSAYELHPSIIFFKLGMKVALSTNKPLFSSMTREPLIEEYSVAGSIHKLSNVDLCELSRNSVLISGFNGCLKKHWIGIHYNGKEIVDYEDIDDFAVQRSNVPKMRTDYRNDTMHLEHKFLHSVSNLK